jgi:hypothetical protein
MPDRAWSHRGDPKWRVSRSGLDRLGVPPGDSVVTAQANWFVGEPTSVGAKLFGSFTSVRAVLHGLRRSRLVDR